MTLHNCATQKDRDVSNQLTRYWAEVGKIRRILKDVVPADLSRLGIVGVSGSAALHWCQHDLMVGPQWGPPKAVDVFVCMNDYDYASFVSSFRKALHKLCHAFAIGKHSMPASFSGPEHTVNRVRHLGFRAEICLVQSRCASLTTTVRRFNSNVNRVIYDIHECTYKVEDAVRCAIERGVVIIQNMSFTDNTMHDIACICQTIIAATKYRRRGFRIQNHGGVIFYGAPNAASA